jgi:predicted transcriptional regulator
MRALCLITVKPGKVDNVITILRKVRKTVKEIMVVTGRADIIVVLQGTIDEINNTVIDFKKIKEISSTETLIEVEVDLGWSKP